MPYGRVRSKDLRYFDPALVDLLSGAGSPQLDIPNGGAYVGTVKTMHDNSVRDFRRLRAKGVIVLNDMLLETQTQTPSDVDLTCQSYAGYPTVRLHGNYSEVVKGAAASPGFNPPDQEGMVQLALMKAYAKMNQSTICSGEIMKDLATTVNMIRHPLEGSVRHVKKILARRGRLLKKSGRNSAQATAQAWLEYSYGWKPLVMDLTDGINGILSVRQKHYKKRLVVRTSERFSQESSASVTDVNSGGIRVSGTTERTERLTVSAGIIFSIETDGAGQQLGQILGTRVSDLPSTVWECIPFSFVADWFVNIGDFLSAVITAPGIEVLGSWATGVHKVSYNYSGSLAYNRGSQWTSAAFEPFSVIQENVSRSVNPALQQVPRVIHRNWSLPHVFSGCSLSLIYLDRLLRRLRH